MLLKPKKKTAGKAKESMAIGKIGVMSAARNNSSKHQATESKGE